MIEKERKKERVERQNKDIEVVRNWGKRYGSRRRKTE